MLMNRLFGVRLIAVIVLLSGCVSASPVAASPSPVAPASPVATTASGADCPPVPTDVAGLIGLPTEARLACFSGRPITVRARLVGCNCDVDGGSYDPAWFGGGSQPLLLVDPSETNPPTDYKDWFIVRLDPAGRYPAKLPVGNVVDVSGMFDHPAAMACLHQGVPVEPAGSPAPTSDCRYMFATTSLIEAGGDG